MKVQCWLIGAVAASVMQVALAAEEPVLNIYNWNDYIAKGSIAKFEKETGIKVRYDLYDSNEILQAKLLTGKAGYDLVVPSVEFAGKHIQAGVHQPVVKARLSRYGTLNKTILKGCDRRSREQVSGALHVGHNRPGDQC